MAQPGSVPVEDGTEITQQAWQNLRANAGLRVQPILDFVRDADQHRTSLGDRQALVDQAALMFDHLYPHMPFKAELYQLTHPSDYLRGNVQPALEALSETDFHAQMIAAFSLVRDAHTLYGLPSPYRGAVAFLPFEIRPYLDPKAGWRFFVTSVMVGFPLLGPGAEIVGWGDVSPLDHVQRTEGYLPGGNFFASLTRAAIHTTLRPLTFVQLPFPDELPEVALHYKPAKSHEVRIIRVPWAVATGFSPGEGFPSRAFSISPAAMMAKQCGKVLHGGAANSSHDSNQDPQQGSIIPAVFDFRYGTADLADPQQPDARFGYLCIHAFSDGSSAPGSTERMVAEFQRIVALMDQNAADGLVIDIRGNPGGDVQAAEQMLQMLTPGIIEPAHFHLANTAAVLSVLHSLNTLDAAQLSPEDDVRLSEARSELDAWADDAGNTPLPHGKPLTSGRTLTDAASANAIGQVYHGRGVALLIDSLTYSAADIFAAGFQDHSIGPILGTSLLTGGGGANVWSHQDLVNKLGPKPGVPIATLPGDASMSLAIRRCSRVGPFKGQPVEDKGVQVDTYYLTDGVDDLVADNPGILGLATQQFRGRPECRVDASAAVMNADGSVNLEVRTIGIASLKFFLNGHLADVASACSKSYTVPAVAGVVPAFLRIEGYSPHHALLRARTIHLAEPVAPPAFDPATQSITGDIAGLT